MFIAKKHLIIFLFLVVGIATIYQFLMDIGSGFCYLDMCYPKIYNFEKMVFLNVQTKPTALLRQPMDAIINIMASLTAGYSNNILFLIIFALGSFWFYKNFDSNEKIGTAAVFGAILVFNPFIYSRIMMGQWGVAFSVITMPIFVYYLFEYFKSPTNRNIIFAVASFMLSSSFQFHFFVINSGMAFLYFLLNLYNEKFDKKPVKCISSFAKLIAILFLVNLYWIIPSIYLYATNQNTIFEAIDESHLSFFSPKESQTGNTLFISLAMYGAWRENGIILARDIIPTPIFLLTLFVIVYLTITGFVANPKNIENIFLLIVGVAGLFLATGVSHPWTSEFFKWSFNNIPFFSGFRDSNKFLGLLVVSYALLGTRGLKEILKNQPFFIKCIIVTAVLSSLIIYNYPQIGLSNQLHPLKFPKCYNELNNYLNKLPSNKNIIYLPWNEYMNYNWSMAAGIDGKISTPINALVDKYIITGTYFMDFSVLAGFPNKISACINTQDTDCMKKLGVNYVIYDKTNLLPKNDSKFDYSWINKLNATYNNDCTTVFKVG